MATDSTVRLSIEVPTEINEQLARYLPWGTKAEALRSLVELFLRECAITDGAPMHLLNGKYKLTLQNLNKPSCEVCDE